MAGSQAVIQVRQLFDHLDFAEVVRLQQAVWGFADAELVPMRLLIVISKIGGHVFGAFDGERMVGFCMALPGVKPGGHVYLHSQMLGVLPEYRDHGLGRSLKLKQREEALSRGIDLIEWTFDPMELKNAFFNIERLGAIVRRYHENAYGVTASPLHGGLPTDRLFAEWWIANPRVEAVLAGKTGAPAPAECAIAFPADIARIRAEDPGRAREIQKENGEKFRRAFAQGLTVTRFVRAETESRYLLEHDDEN